MNRRTSFFVFLRLPSPMNLFSNLIASGAVISALHAQAPNPLTIAPTGPNEFRLDWFAEDLRSYQIEGSHDFLSWVRVGPAVVGVGAYRTLLVTATEPAFFYRLRSGAIRPGFDGVEMSRNDDRTYPWPVSDSAPVPLGFSISFYGASHSSCFVNNNGNITFGDSLRTYTPGPFGLLGTKIIAPFWADVDTRNPASEVTRFSSGGETANGRPAFGVTYRDVGYFEQKADKLNSFQILLINRSDVAAGDFDIEFNYDQILWETGDASSGVNGYHGFPARAGYASGNGSYAEVQGSGDSLALIDADPATGVPNFATGLIHQSLNSTVPGRLVIPVRGGVPAGTFTVNAGPDQVLNANHSASFQLNGTVPQNIPGLTFTWTKISGTAATISNAHVLNPTVTITEPGTFEFELTAKAPGFLEVTAADTVQIQHPAVFVAEAGGNYLFTAADPLTIPSMVP